ncbi:PAS domain-containing protein [Kordiimonas marina]|uniref:PAS domain-containing protein n=1 Tax=Kordiimonas marina TaxID=2872312 RepID=UPI001FF2F850|nr:PAS domain-containing protein [Kordiimonas marina]MCJ9427649.1 PAS domain-containing protein [Kordiimonas marina]
MPTKGYEPVTEFPDFADHQQIRDFFDAWHRWRGEALVPKRSQIKPGEIPHLMSGCMLLDMYGLDRIVFRYAGSLLQDFYGVDFTGKNYYELTAPADRDMRARRLLNVAEQPAAAVWTTPAIDTVDFVGASVPVLPDDLGQPLIVMQVMVHLRDLHHVRPSTIAQRHDTVHLSQKFRYLDIGAGLPDQSVEA